MGRRKDPVGCVAWTIVALFLIAIVVGWYLQTLQFDP